MKLKEQKKDEKKYFIYEDRRQGEHLVGGGDAGE